MKSAIGKGLLLVFIVMFAMAGCDTGKPMPTQRLERILPDGFGDYILVNTVRNAGGPMVSEITGHYQATNENAPLGLGTGGEIRIVVQDWGAPGKSSGLPSGSDPASFDYRGLRCYPGFPAGLKAYEVRIPVGGRILIRLVFDDVGAQDKLERTILDAINWNQLAKILPDWRGLQ